MLDNWKTGFARFYRNLPLQNQQRLRRHMLIQLILSFVLVWMCMRAGPDKRGWLLFFVVWTAIDLVLLQWIYDINKTDKLGAKSLPATGGSAANQADQDAQK
jgi:hypothetical protein